MRVIRVQQVLSDGSSAEARTFPYYPDVDLSTGKPYSDDRGVPWVEITLRPVTKAQHRTFVKAHTTTTANGSGVMDEKVDWDAVAEDVVAAAVVSWRGIVGADDQPLKCIDGTKRALDAGLQVQIRNRAMYAQPAEVAAASFREPAPVL